MTKPDPRLLDALQHSADCLRMAEKLLRDGGMPATARYLAQQAAENTRIINTTAGLG